MVLVSHNCRELLHASGVHHHCEWVMAREKQSQRALVQHEIKRFVHLGVTLLYSPLAHLLHSLLLVNFIKYSRVGYLLKAWSFIKGVNR